MSENDKVDNYGIKELLTNNAISSSEFYIQAKAQMSKQIEELVNMYDKVLQMRFSACATKMDLLLLKENIETMELALEKYQEEDVTPSQVHE